MRPMKAAAMEPSVLAMPEYQNQVPRARVPAPYQTTADQPPAPTAAGSKRDHSQAASGRKRGIASAAARKATTRGLASRLTRWPSSV